MTKTDTKASVKTLTAILSDSERPHAATALANVDALAELHSNDVLAPFVEGYCYYLAKGKGQGALDALRKQNSEVYGALRARIIKASGVTRATGSRGSAVTPEVVNNIAAFLEA